MELRLPAPCVVVLIGPAGAGKTTWALEHFASNEVVSSDSLRAAVGVDEDDMSASSAAFELLERIVDERIERRLTTVIDSTGLESERRRRWIDKAHAAGIPVHAIVFATDIETVEQSNRNKAHPIPKTVLRRQLAKLATAMEEVGLEGFDGLHSRQPVRAVTPTLLPARPSQQRKTGHTFGLLVSRFDWATEDLGGAITDIALRAEDAGFTDIWFMDHFRQIPGVGRPWEDIPEAFTALSYVAGSTTRIRLGVLVAAITHRQPVVLGKMIATLDVLSGGRAICGLGVGWDAKEHDSYGIAMPPLGDRYELLEDTLQMLPLLWGKGTPSFRGKILSAEELICYPRPLQDPIPILVGGSGEEKTLRLVARHANACNLFGSPDVVGRKVRVLERHCRDLDRDPAEITVTHLTTAMAASTPSDLRARVKLLRGRNTSTEEFSSRHNAGLIEDLVGLFTSYSEAGARHSIVTLPDVALAGSIEDFGQVIASLDRP